MRARTFSGVTGRRASKVRRVGLLAALALLSACASTGGGRTPFAYLTVINDSPSMVAIYALPGGNRVRMGQVNGISQKELPVYRLHLDGSGRLRLLIDPVGSTGQYATDTVMVLEGDEIEYRVSPFIR
jgi:hypothetical protein